MLECIRAILEATRHLFFWLILAVAVTLTSFQVHATLISVAIVVIDNPSLRPTGWTSGTIYGLSRLLWLILGMGWLGWVMYTYEYFRESKQLKILTRFFRLLLILGAVYFCSYVVLLFLAWTKLVLWCFISYPDSFNLGYVFLVRTKAVRVFRVSVAK